MKLVILTNMYPYGDQEAFIEPEMKVFENLFDSIHILTLAPIGTDVTRYVPKNAKVTHVMKKDDSRILTAFSLLKPSVIKDILFTAKRFDYSLRTSVSAMLNFYEKSCPLFIKYLKQEDRSKTIFYSYWLSHFAYALMKFKKQYPEAFCVSRAHRVDNFIEFKASMYRREIVSALDGIYPISLEGKKELENRVLPYITGKHAELEVFHLGVELPKIVNPPKKKDKMIIASCSFIHRIKRLDIMIDALAQIDDIEIEWVHFGGGQDEAQIKEMAKEKLGSKPNVSFELRGQTAHDDILAYYTQNHVDLFVNTSDHEGIPVSIMEAMATGIICTAREVGGNGELISDKENGFLLPKDATAEYYAKIIRKVYNMNPEAVNIMKKSAMLTVTEKFSSPEMYERFAEHIICRFKSRA